MPSSALGESAKLLSVAVLEIAPAPPNEPTAPLVASDSQRSAIEAPPGPSLVLAGPGSGKTYCLIQRIRYLIEQCGVDAKRICAFTFTNKAADEIGKRLDDLGSRAEGVRRGTIHAFCAERQCLTKAVKEDIIDACQKTRRA